MPQICIFEDLNYANLYPLTLTRPAYLLRLGLKDILSKILAAVPSKNNTVLHCRQELLGTLSEKTFLPVNNLKKEETIFINGRVLPEQNFLEAYRLLAKSKEGVILQDNIPVLAKLPKNKLEHFKMPDFFKISNFKDLKIIYPGQRLTLLNYFWDFIAQNGSQIISEANKTNLLGKHLSRTNAAVLVEPGNIFIGKDVILKPGVVLDASSGPVIIDNGAELLPNAVVIGPVYIGEKTVIKAGAKIYPNTSIGPLCKIGGELEGVIVQGYSNKQHEGFLGHSFIGEWCNLGAGTENSDLKNNYSAVSVLINNKPVDSKSQFVGSCLGDHAKTGIKTMLNTGSVFGVFCNLFGAGYQPKYLPSFTWNDNNNKLALHTFPEALETAKIVMKRRRCNMSPAQEDLYKYLFDNYRLRKK